MQIRAAGCRWQDLRECLSKAPEQRHCGRQCVWGRLENHTTNCLEAWWRRYGSAGLGLHMTLCRCQARCEGSKLSSRSRPSRAREAFPRVGTPDRDMQQNVGGWGERRDSPCRSAWLWIALEEGVSRGVHLSAARGTCPQSGQNWRRVVPVNIGQETSADVVAQAAENSTWCVSAEKDSGLAAGAQWGRIKTEAQECKHEEAPSGTG